ncbi:type I-U CRISPR-associated RAMP protein Csb1/Cas7u [Thiococcus pfennigii]|uniref:type I-G CRISPR-associated RAMP protein Csb1/Cas7g n=1 Tax=Thiococcus pfennigii TaxID=1057 RepID=UPI001902D864|nr:type I-U CRISPR-associated RAMP protein Csb1/Cas7u [Thiococcus pfennigii]MBK1731104.1 type I-U CRISPR-associated protein Cas7 [Thiococcus pfennigii]
MSLELETLKAAVAGSAAAFRCVTEYQPMGGPGDKVFPPTYEGGRYATEARVDPATGERVDCVLLDSVQSQANRMELALLDALEERGSLALPLIRVAFADIPKPIRVTSLDAPHRAADAIFRDSRIEEDGEWRAFRESSKGRILDHADLRHATGLFGLCPTALVFGLWDSTGPRGGLGAKFQRALVSEIVGYGAVEGKKTSSRIDPLQIMLGAGPVYAAADGDWTLSEAEARKEKGKSVKIGKDGKPSEINHGNVTPSIADGGFTLTRAVQTTVLSLPTLRRLRFPLPDGAGTGQVAISQAARTTLAALGLAAATLAREEGADLRSRCQLFPTGPFVWELLDRPGETPTRFALTGAEAVDLLNRAIDEARQSGLPWEGTIDLTPSPDLVELVRRSQHLAAQADGED